ncbi:DUF2007 domain-containing protein [Pedobacter changchengzhani]|uniref:DUF2007 domain-containing protein n=1 Tax=Pedobacter changchengzhani TaxID=2529274 RepID=A0A4R5MI52_9SPHI|nr:DUF2007 domain-containing protein [Pedobacter changchengzhani]TDG35260.1 DUF2007 domain-containing protein [Pedobacter changchengzhani]
MNDRTTVYASYYNPIEANIIKTRLDDAGFACFLADENISTINPLYNQAVGGVRLIVFERDVEEIKAFLGEDNAIATEEEEVVNEDNVVCENCGSTNVSYGQATQKRFSWWVTIISLLTASYPFKANKCYHCYACGHEFE